MKNLLIAPNAFKECADAVEITSIIRNYFSSRDFNIISMPLSDGGDGFLNVCKEKLNYETNAIKIPAPIGEMNILMEIGVDSGTKTVFLESAKVLGLRVIPRKLRNPMHLNSYGLGKLFKIIAKDYSTIEKVIIGIGGTATNDLALGAAEEYGLKLYDSASNSLSILPKNYIIAASLEYEPVALPFKIEVVVDVDNPLLGENGATRMFSPQKGASQGDVEIMEEGFKNIINLLEQKGLITPDQALNGAGGGLAAGLQVLFNAELTYSRDFIINTLSLKEIPSDDLIVVTGEGRFDSQTLMNKAPGVIINHFYYSSAKVFIICGTAEEGITKKLPPNVKIIELQKYFRSKVESLDNYRFGLTKACLEIIKSLD